jgi:hypothetical protein
MSALAYELASKIAQQDVILFVGAGVSRNLGLPMLNDIIDHVAKQLEYDPAVFATYADAPTLIEYYFLQEPDARGELRSWMDSAFHPQSIDISQSNVHRLIVSLGFTKIYTTNYDRWLELAFEAFSSQRVKVVRGIADLARHRQADVEIVKFHGDLYRDDSIVLSQSSYFERFGFDHPLDIKLRSDSLGKTLLFIGYSLSDMNILYLLYKLKRIWSSEPYQKFKPQSYVLDVKPNPIRQVILRDLDVIPIESEIEEPGKALEIFLETLRPAR